MQIQTEKYKHMNTSLSDSRQYCYCSQFKKEFNPKLCSLPFIKELYVTEDFSVRHFSFTISRFFKRRLYEFCRRNSPTSYANAFTVKFALSEPSETHIVRNNDREDTMFNFFLRCTLCWVVTWSILCYDTHHFSPQHLQALLPLSYSNKTIHYYSKQ